jgi:hypothetical protein
VVTGKDAVHIGVGRLGRAATRLVALVELIKAGTQLFGRGVFSKWRVMREANRAVAVSTFGEAHLIELSRGDVELGERRQTGAGYHLRVDGRSGYGHNSLQDGKPEKRQGG